VQWQNFDYNERKPALAGNRTRNFSSELTNALVRAKNKPDITSLTQECSPTFFCKELFEEVDRTSLARLLFRKGVALSQSVSLSEPSLLG